MHDSQQVVPGGWPSSKQSEHMGQTAGNLGGIGASGESRLRLESDVGEVCVGAASVWFVRPSEVSEVRWDEALVSVLSVIVAHVGTQAWVWQSEG